MLTVAVPSTEEMDTGFADLTVPLKKRWNSLAVITEKRTPLFLWAKLMCKFGSTYLTKKDRLTMEATHEYNATRRVMKICI